MTWRARNPIDLEPATSRKMASTGTRDRTSHFLNNPSVLFSSAVGMLHTFPLTSSKHTGIREGKLCDTADRTCVGSVGARRLAAGADGRDPGNQQDDGASCQ